MTRILSLLLVFVAAVTVHGQGTTVIAGGPPPEPVNVLFINIDDMNDWTQMMERNPQIQTPQMERLAEMGTYFTNAHSQYARCVQSRSSYMSGLYPSTFDGYGVPGALEGSEIKDAEGVIAQADLLGTRTLEGYFKDSGYKIYMIGKIYHDGKAPLADVSARGGGGSAGTPANAANFPGHGTGTDWGIYAEGEASDEDMGDYQKASWAIEMLNAHPEDQPFFIGIGFNLPHVPWYVPQKWADLYPANETLWKEPFYPELWEVKNGENDPARRDNIGYHYGPSELNPMPGGAVTKLQQGYPNLIDPDNPQYVGEQGWREITQAYAASISFVDDQIGRILDALANSPHADNTVIVAFSDHGYHLGSKMIFTKHNLWDRSTQTPLFFAGPGVPAGHMLDTAVELVDVYPTLLALTHLPPNPANEGDNLVPLMEEPQMTWDKAAHAFHFNAWGAKDDQAVILENWRYIYYSDNAGEQELYNTANDPYETTNLASDPSQELIRTDLDQRRLPHQPHITE